MFFTAEKDENHYKYMSSEEAADFNKRLLDLLENAKCKEIQIQEERGFTRAIGEGERVYIIEVYEKDEPIFDDSGYTQAVAIMGHEELIEFKKSIETEKNVEIKWLDI